VKTLKTPCPKCGVLITNKRHSRHYHIESCDGVARTPNQRKYWLYKRKLVAKDLADETTSGSSEAVNPADQSHETNSQPKGSSIIAGLVLAKGLAHRTAGTVEDTKTDGTV
jgi:hypothetical protein